MMVHGGTSVVVLRTVWLVNNGWRRNLRFHHETQKGSEKPDVGVHIHNILVKNVTLRIVECHSFILLTC